ncbi:DUF5641 domain-containing protein [Trichonephila clavipes]|uniref:DUF5641 domain-containing protein n=1 Tax=Trichonephila clavipes TaxID=2585209 RepID=A0A8X6WLE4_TRICX|nr:DUF5641 domain-containing protein [Trichonephila clavipes]
MKNSVWSVFEASLVGRKNPCCPIGGLKDQYYDIKDISDSELEVIEADLQGMEDRLEKLWGLKLEWDEPLSNTIAKESNDFVSILPVIQNIHVPRHVIGKGRIIIHGFVNTSTAAYAAVLYAQSISEEDVSTRLLCSKSRVAPVKPITIARLELCVCYWHSSWQRFLHNSRNPSVKRSGQLDNSEVNKAELCLIKNLQDPAFKKEIEYLAKGSCNSKMVKYLVWREEKALYADHALTRSCRPESATGEPE